MATSPIFEISIIEYRHFFRKSSYTHCIIDFPASICLAPVVPSRSIGLLPILSKTNRPELSTKPNASLYVKKAHGFSRGSNTFLLNGNFDLSKPNCADKVAAISSCETFFSMHLPAITWVYENHLHDDLSQAVYVRDHR